MSYHIMSNDLTHFWQEQGVKRTILIGHSMGGKTAMLTALTHPEMVEKLVVVDVAPCTAPGSGESGDIVTALRQLNLSQLRDRREADAKLKGQIPVIYAVK